MGYLSTQGHFSPHTLKRALAFGTVVASYTISDFSLPVCRPPRAIKSITAGMNSSRR